MQADTEMDRVLYVDSRSRLLRREPARLIVNGNYELKKGGRLGPGKDDAKEILVLNRVIRYTNEGLEYEADPAKGRDSWRVWVSTGTAIRRPRLG